MSQITYRGNLSAKSFPFISDNWGRTVIVPGPDNTFNRQVSSEQDSDKDVGIPQIYYGHNVMPHAQGMQSVGYTPVIPGLSPFIGEFDHVLPIRDATGYKTYMGITRSGDIYVYTSPAGPAVPTVWTYMRSYPAGLLVTTAYVNGITYIFVAGQQCFRFDFGANNFINVVLTGLALATTYGIVGAAGYLIAWGLSAVAWSSTVDPTDFVPSLITGAGGGTVSDLKGTITVCAAHIQGFIVYGTENAVASIYSANARYPFNFRPITNSGGIGTPRYLAIDTNTGNHYAYTTYGMQSIATNGAQTIYPEITDFVAGKLFEDFNEMSQQFVLTPLTTTMRKTLGIISGRYLVISYGVTNLTHAIVFDITQKRYGKLKIEHVDVFEYNYPSVVVTETPRQSIGFVKANGEVQVVDFTVTSAGSNGVLLLGKYQYVRARLITLDTIDLENVQVGVAFSCTILTSVDGKNIYSTTTPTLLNGDGKLRRYGSRATGINHSLLLQGAWHIESNVLVFNTHGKM